MRILVDGDATPYKDEIYSLTKTYHIEMHVYVDYAHILKDVPYQVIECDVGHDSVDLLLLSHLQKQDILITQDYGLAALALGKGAYILHVSGMEITSQNIDELFIPIRIFIMQLNSVSIFCNSTALCVLSGSLIPMITVIIINLLFQAFWFLYYQRVI